MYKCRSARVPQQEIYGLTVCTRAVGQAYQYTAKLGNEKISYNGIILGKYQLMCDSENVGTGSTIYYYICRL